MISVGSHISDFSEAVLFIVFSYRSAAVGAHFQNSANTYNSCHKVQPGPFAQCDSVETGQNRISMHYNKDTHARMQYHAIKYNIGQFEAYQFFWR